MDFGSATDGNLEPKLRLQLSKTALPTPRGRKHRDTKIVNFANETYSADMKFVAPNPTNFSKTTEQKRESRKRTALQSTRRNRIA